MGPVELLGVSVRVRTWGRNTLFDHQQEQMRTRACALLYARMKLSRAMREGTITHGVSSGWVQEVWQRHVFMASLHTGC